MDMSAIAKSSSKVSVATPIVLYGLDANQKPQAARFPDRVCDLAIKAARQLKLNILKVTSAQTAELAARLPAGRINSSGRALLANVRKPLYDQLVEMARGTETTIDTTPASTHDHTKIPLNEVGKDGNSVGSDRLPPAWKDIGPNHLVLVQESLRDGWWEAIVIARRDDMLTVRWRDYQKWKPFLVHADAVALINPSPSFKA
jgi:hypothetical protein